MSIIENTIDKFIFKAPVTVCITGPTSSGKTQFMFKIIKNRKALFTLPVKKVIYCYKVWQNKFDNFISNGLHEDKEEVIFHEGTL